MHRRQRVENVTCQQDRETVFHDVMNRVNEISAGYGVRTKEIMFELSSKLEGDNFKKFEAQLTDGLL